MTKPCSTCTNWRRGCRVRDPWKPGDGKSPTYSWSSTCQWGTCYGVPPVAQPSDDGEPFHCTHETDTCPNHKAE